MRVKFLFLVVCTFTIGIVGCSSSNSNSNAITVKPLNGYYFSMTSVLGETLNVGPYPDQLTCRDMLGSVLNSHPDACHRTGPYPPSNCANTGNGFGYPPSEPYPPIRQIPSSDCFIAPVKGGLAQGWYFFGFDGDDISINKCSELKMFKQKPNVEIGRYVNNLCPGYPCFSVGGLSTACE